MQSLRRVDPASGPPQLVSFVFDRLSRGAALDARRTAERILGTIPDQGYTLAVLQVSSRLRLLQSYTPDFHLTDVALQSATSAASPAFGSALTSAEKTVLASVGGNVLRSNDRERTESRTLLSAMEQSQRIVEDRHSYPSLAALQSLIFCNRLLPGRKFVFYFANGLAPTAAAREGLASIVSSASRAGVILWVIDTSPQLASMASAMAATSASGLLGAAGTGGATAFGAVKGARNADSGMNNVYAKNVAGFEFGSIDVERSPLAGVAIGTGGTYVSASGVSRRQLEQLHADMTNWYQATWQPAIEHYDGQFRPLDIRSKRKDVVVRARSGYFAVPSTDTAEILPFEVPLLHALSGTTMPSDIAMRTGVLHLGALPDGNAAELLVQVPVSQLDVHEDGTTHLASVDVAMVAVIKDMEGNVLQRFGGDFPLHEPAGSRHESSGQVVTLQRTFSAAPGLYTLETAAMDRFSKKVGAGRTTFTLQAPAPGPALSDIALVHNVEPVEPSNGSFEPMRYLDGHIIPNLDPDLGGNTNSLSLFFLLHPVPGSQKQPTLHMQVTRDGRVLTDLPMELSPVSGTGAAIPYLASIRGQVFPPGEYKVQAQLTQDGGTASSTASFRIGAASADSLNQATTAVSSTEVTSDRDVASSQPAGAVPSPDSASPQGGFEITRPRMAIPAPTEAESQAMIADARKRALAWSDSLRNFLCLEMTNHFVSTPENEGWTRKGTLVETLKYVDHIQTRTTVELNGEPSNVQPDRLDFAHSNGEFGAMFRVVFDPAAQTSFTWKEASVLDGQPVQVFAFAVTRAHSGFHLGDRENHIANVGFHGVLFLDPVTGNIRRISVIADDIPARVLMRASSMSVDYAWVSMQNHEFLLPIRGAVSLQESKKLPVLNEFEFRDYHRFGSKVRILTSAGGQSVPEE